MTEAEWVGCTDPTPMLEFIRGKASARKLRLFQVACCRRIWALVTDPGSRAVVEIVERAADAPVDERAVRALPYDWLTDDCGGPSPAERHAYMTAGHVGYSLLGPLHGGTFASGDWQDAVSTANGAATAVAEGRDIPPGGDYPSEYQGHMMPEQAAQCDLLRDLFGNPFRPVAAGPRWLTSTVVSLAEAIYADRAFDRLPILADALEDAGCDDADIHSHARGPGEHVRGCWAVDLVLGRG